jgi:hypothetical protein
MVPSAGRHRHEYDERRGDDPGSAHALSVNLTRPRCDRHRLRDAATIGGMGAANVDGALTPNPVLVRDATTLIGLLAHLEGALMVEETLDEFATRLRARFIAEGVLSSQSNERDLRQVINDMNHRLRYAVGEYSDPPSPVWVPG